MRISVAQDVGWPAPGAKCEPKQTPQVLPQRHEQPSQDRRGGKMGEDAERGRWVGPGEGKINKVEKQRGPKGSLCSGFPCPGPPAPTRGLFPLVRRGQPTPPATMQSPQG